MIPQSIKALLTPFHMLLCLAGAFLLNYLEGLIQPEGALRKSKKREKERLPFTSSPMFRDYWQRELYDGDKLASPEQLTKRIFSKLAINYEWLHYLDEKGANDAREDIPLYNDPNPVDPDLIPLTKRYQKIYDVEKGLFAQGSNKRTPNRFCMFVFDPGACPDRYLEYDIYYEIMCRKGVHFALSRHPIAKVVFIQGSILMNTDRAKSGRSELATWIEQGLYGIHTACLTDRMRSYIMNGEPGRMRNLPWVIGLEGVSEGVTERIHRYLQRMVPEGYDGQITFDDSPGYAVMRNQLKLCRRHMYIFTRQKPRSFPETSADSIHLN